MMTLEELYQADIRGRKLIAKNIGIRVSLKEAYKEYAIQVKAPSHFIKTKRGKRRHWPYLTTDQKRQAFLNAVLKDAQNN